ncbi:flagellar biosynthesis protein FlgD [Roseomonas sp. GC11]|uniref:flagellar hook assembly protein FlgD n=1 Tax=Roseomonas sp. GC11 TaxID=2950546 RepID=UPI00210BB956|nr:flagellar hook capping FlgD N-terminal domain-containing protein [Roseomonas sp. GC11]MCQ4162291.1 flagellar biosynthesis protein FlgD [Roseomonas sp. GC11]
MASTTITSATTSSSSTSSSSSSKTQLSSDLNSFLTLLTTQLQNQDPLNPTDSTEFTSQLAQFSQVEQQIATNEHLESLLSLQQSSSMLSATGLVGDTVAATSSSIVLEDGSTQSINLPSTSDAGGAQSVVITLTNSSGTVVRSETVSLSGDATSWSWDGKNSSGKSASDGSYTVSITGYDSAGTSTGDVDFTVSGKVTSVTRDSDGNPVVHIGGLTVDLSAVQSMS